MDRLTRSRRSWLMSRVASKNTSPELRVRKAAHAAGLRFRVHRKDLPGTPDLVFPRWQIVLFVHGCFWHRHEGCSKSTMPKTRAEYWSSKFAHNVQRDRRIATELRNLGWNVHVIWECETKSPTLLVQRIWDIFDLFPKVSDQAVASHFKSVR